MNFHVLVNIKALEAGEELVVFKPKADDLDTTMASGGGVKKRRVT